MSKSQEYLNIFRESGHEILFWAKRILRQRPQVGLDDLWPPSIISRYLGLTFLRFYGIALLGFIGLYTAIDFVEKIDDFIGQSIGFKTTILFFLAQLPKITVLMSPVAALVGVLICLAVLARSSEVVAFKAGGVSLYRLSAPILGCALVISGIMFVIGDQIAPKTNFVANSIWDGQVRKRLDRTNIVHDVWLKGVLMVQHLGTYDGNAKTVSDYSLALVDESGKLTKRIEAKSGQYTAEGDLVLSGVLEKIYDNSPNNRHFLQKQYKSLPLTNWAAPPVDFGRSDQNSEELSVAQLWNLIDRLTAEGFGPVRQRVDLQFKFSFAFLPVIMVVVGLPLGFWREKGSSVALGLAFGLGLSFAYLIAMELARSLGYSGLLPPLLAAWVPNLIYLLFGAYLFSYVRQ